MDKRTGLRAAAELGHFRGMKVRVPDVAIGDRLRSARLMRRWSVAGLAIVAGVPTLRVLKLEHNLREPTLRELIALSDALDVSTDELLRGRSSLES